MQYDGQPERSYNPDSCSSRRFGIYRALQPYQYKYNRESKRDSHNQSSGILSERNLGICIQGEFHTDRHQRSSRASSRQGAAGIYNRTDKCIYDYL